MLTDLVNRTLKIDSYDGAASGSSHEEQTCCCDATVGKPVQVWGLELLKLNGSPWSCLALPQIMGMARMVKVIMANCRSSACPLSRHC